MLLSVSAVLVSGVIVLVLVRSGRVNAAVAAVCALFGFFLAGTGAAPSINHAVDAVAHLVGSIGR